MKTAYSILLLLIPVISLGQCTMKSFLEEECQVVFFGLDFSHARMIGSEGFNDPVAIKEQYFTKWNHLMISESDKYAWDKALLTSGLEYDYDMIEEVNEKVNVKSLVINRSYNIPESEIPNIIKAYNIQNHKEGIGVVLVVESFNKIKEMAYGYIVFFDISSKKVLYHHQLIGKPSGFGFRNYWAGAIYDWVKYTKSSVMRDIKREFN